MQLVDHFKEKLLVNLQRSRADNVTYDVLLLGAIGKVSYYGNDSMGARMFSGYMGNTSLLLLLPIPFFFLYRCFYSFTFRWEPKAEAGERLFISTFTTGWDARIHGVP